MSAVSTVSPRLTMAHLPSFLQRPLTWLTGKPLPGQRPLFGWTPATRTLAGLGTTALGVAATATAIFTGGVGWLLLAPGFVLTTGGQRALYLEIAHNAVHHAWSGTRWLDRLVTEVFTTITFTNGYDVFRRSHVGGHHGKNGTLDDPDYATLLRWGIEPGLPAPTLGLRSATLLLDPRAHFDYFAGRFRDNLLAGPWYRRAAALLWNGGLLAAAAATGAWGAFLLAWWLPLVIGFQISSMLQMVGGEHRWGLDLPPGKERVQQLTYGRFLGEPFPARGRLAQLRWWLRVLFLHLPARLGVFVGNDIGPAHDVHHRIPGFDWANAAYRREELRAAGRLPGATDAWGSLGGLIVTSIRSMASSPRPRAGHDL